MDKNNLWESTLAQLQMDLSAANFQTWFKGKTTLVSLDENLVEIGCSSSYVKNWLESRYHGQIKSILDKATAKNISIVFSVRPLEKEVTNKSKLRRVREAYSLPALFTNTDVDELQEALTKARLNPAFSFNAFVSGKSNQLAYAAAKAVSELGDKPYNPLFIYGGVGVGKTHLIQAIAQEALAKNPKLKVFYSTCEEFTNDLVAAIQTKTTTNFRAKYRSADLLVIDDVQFLSGRESTQEEVFHTFNALFAARKQVVLAADRQPALIGRLAERLKSRFEAGMIADIAAPEFELREAVLYQKCKDRSVQLPTKIIRLLAQVYVNNIRDLEGGFIRLLTYSKFSNQPVSEDLVQQVLQLTRLEKTAQTNSDFVILQVAKYFSLSIKDLKSASRRSDIVFPRQIAMYILRMDLTLPLQKIASLLNKSDHTSVIYSVEKIKRVLDGSSKTRGLITQIRARVFTNSINGV